MSKNAIPFELTRFMPLAGVTIGDRQDMIARLSEGERLFLDREPDNHHDKNAVAVYSSRGQIGYVRAAEAALLAPLIDGGTPVTAQVIETTLFDAQAGEKALGVRLQLLFGEDAFAAPEPKAKRGFAEKMIAAGESMEKAGQATSKAGTSIMSFGCATVALIVIVVILYVVFK